MAASSWLNLPAVLVMILVTTVLVIGIRESARTNALLVLIKLTVVVFVIAIGIGYVAAEQLDGASRSSSGSCRNNGRFRNWLRAAARESSPIRMSIGLRVN